MELCEWQGSILSVFLDDKNISLYHLRTVRSVYYTIVCAASTVK